MIRRFLRPQYFCLGLLIGLLGWCGHLGQVLYLHSQQPVDAVLVLGGSIRREMVVAAAIAQNNTLPVLISKGSPSPCIRAVFDRAHAPVDRVWLETCAQSTFGNYRYSLATLQQWQSQHVRVVTSESHLPRAHWLGAVMLGSHGIWVDVQPVQEQGRPGNREHPLKTIADLSRGLVWAIISQVHRPTCFHLTPLAAIDLAVTDLGTLGCEHQADLDNWQPE